MGVLIKIWNLALDIFFPPLCLNCKVYLDDIAKLNLLCEKCFTGIRIYNFPSRITPDFTLLAAGAYEDRALRTLIHYFKYERFLSAQKPLGEMLIKHLEFVKPLFAGAIVTAIPLHPKRLRGRGFNQSELIAARAAEYFGLEFATNVLKRVKNNRPQMELPDHEKRRRNIKNSFEVPETMRDYIKDKTFLLVDDVYTSGATMREAIRTMRRAGAAKVIGAVIAKAG